MKLSNYFVLFLLLTTITSSRVQAQLAGGTYTIGPFGNFTTLNDAVNALSAGITGPVVFDVDASVVYDESIVIEAIAGSSAVNTVTFRGNGATIARTTQPSSNPLLNASTIFLYGSSYVTIDSFNIVPQAGSSTDGVRLGANAHHNTITNCTIDLSNTSSAYYASGGIYSVGYILGIPFYFLNSPMSLASHCTITNNRIINTNDDVLAYGVNLSGLIGNSGSNTNRIENNSVEGYYYAGISLVAGQDNSVVQGNTIDGRFQIGIHLISTGISISVQNNVVRTDNSILESSNGNIEVYGLLLEDGQGLTGFATQVKNNLIVLESGFFPVTGLATETNNVLFYNNTVHIRTNDVADAIGIHVNRGFSSLPMDNTEVVNNIVSIDGRGQGDKYLFHLANDFWVSSDYGWYDYNSYYFTNQTNNGFFGYSYYTQYSTLADWQAAFGGAYEQNGVYSNPVFTSPATFDFTPNSPVLDNRGFDLISTGTVIKDFNYQTRIPPMDPGALIFTALDENATISELELPTSVSVPGNSDVRVTIQNSGINVLTSAEIKWRVDGGAVQTNSWAGSLVTSAEESNIVLGNLNFSAGTHTFQLWLEDLNGIVGTNSKDTLIEEVVFCNTLSGVYSIGGGAADFPSILDAVESLKSCGVAGPVTFNVDAGIYTGEVVIPEISGASSVNTITFNGNGSIITDFPVYGKRYVVYVKGKHITFRDFTIQSSNPEYGWLYRLGEGAAYNVIDRCTLDASFQTDPVYDGSIGVLSSGSETSAGNVGLPAAYNHHNTVSNNFFKGASTASMSIGVQFMRGDSNTIVGNHFADIEDEGIYSSHSTGGNTISGNTFSYEDRAINDHVVAIRLSQSGGGNIIENNKVDFRDQYFESYTGISIVSSSTGSMNPDIIRNNIIHFRGSARIGKGIEIRRSDFAYILNNTIVAEPDDLETKLSLIYVYGSPSTPNNRVENNLLYLNAEGISPKYFIELRDKADITDYGSFDFNNFFATSNSQNVNVADHHGTTYPSLSDWQLAGGNFDQNSTEFNPNIFFPVDGQYRPTNAQMDNLGKDLLTPGLVVSDFDGSARTIEPDQGALEFIPTSIDIGMTELDVPATPIIPGLHNIEVSFKNYGTNVITSAEIYWQINGGAINTKSFVGALNSRQEENNFFLSSHNFGAGLSEIRVWSSDPNGLADEVPVNDTIIKNINVCNPLNGLYTIGGISPDFPDLNSAVSKLENCGISGPVVFDVAAGSVFNEKVVIHEIFGTSSINTVTFNGNGSTIEYDAQEGDREILFLKGASYLTLDNFVIKSTNPDYYWGLRLGYGAGHNTISNCVFDGTNLSTAYNSTGAIVSSNSDYMTTFGVNAETHDNIIEDNTILGKKILSNVTLQYGIFIRGTAAGAGSASNIIRRNTITNTSGPGIFLTYCEGNQIIAENELRNGEIRVDNGISIYDSGPGILVERNLIVNNSATQSIIRFIRCQGTKTNPHVVRNNILYNKTSSNADAFYISSTNHVHLLNNTLVFDESGSYERGFLLISSDSCVILNNLLSINYKDGYKSSVYSISQTQTESNWDYNNFYVSSSNINPLEFANYLGTIYSTLADWKLAVGGSFDQSSVDYNPFFVDVEAENFTPQNGQLNDLGFDLFTSGQVTEDFFGNPRSAFMDIGAIEFDKSLLDIGVSAIIAPSDGQATGLSAIEVEIENFGIQNVTSTEISFEIDGGAPTTYNWAGSLATGDVTSVVIGNYNFSKGSHVIKAWTENPNASNDDVKANDTIERNVIFCKSYSGIYTVGGVTSDFATFNEAFATLSKCGITGPITLDVQAGESFDERFTIPYIPGSSNINTLLVKGNGARLSPTILNEKSIVTLDSTKYVTIEDLNISVGNTFYDRSLWGFFLTNKAENITIRACSLLIDPNYLWNSFDEFVGVVVSGGLESKTLPTDVSNVLIEGCHFFAPRATSQLGISVEGLAAGNGSSNFTVRDNLIENCRLAGISFHNTSGFHTITNNEIRNTNMNDPEDFLGIKFDYAGVGSIIERNYIHSPRADRQWSLEYSTGIEIRYSAGSPGNENIVRNNIIDFSSLGDWTTGIYLYRSDYISILNNTIIINELTGDHLRFGIRAYSHTNPENELTNCEILNNLIYINDAGSPDKYLINLIGTDQGYYDYNNYFITPQSFNTNVGRSSIDYPTLVDWQTADGASYDQNSFDLDPEFGGAPKTYAYEPSNALLDGAGFDLFTSGRVMEDFYGNPRSASMDIGAVEFELPTLDLEIVTIQPIIDKGCDQDIVIEIRNAATTDITSAEFGFSLNGGADIVGSSFGGNLTSGQTTVVSAGISSFGPGYVALKVFVKDVNGSGVDSNSRNDTVILEFVITNPLPDPPVTTDEIALVGGPIPDLTAIGNNVEWYSDNPPTLLAAVGNTLATGQTTVGAHTYYAVEVDAKGCLSEVTPTILTIYDTDMIIWNGKEYINGSGPFGAPDMTDFAKELHIMGEGASISADAKVTLSRVYNGMDMTIEPDNTLVVSEGIQNDGLIFIENNASLVQESLNDLNTGTGTYQVKRDGIRNAGAFQMWSSPVANAILLGAGGVFDGSNPCRTMVWNASSQRWKYDYIPGSVYDCGGGNITFTARFLMFDDPADNIMDVARGYFLPGQQNSPTVVFEGPVFNGTILKPVFETNSITPYTGDDWNLLGNPYPSALSINDWLTANSAVLSTEAIYLWDDDGSVGADYDEFDDYATINRLGWVNNGTRDMDGNGKFADPPVGIASGQGFFIESRVIGNVTFNNSMRLIGENDKFYKTQPDNDPKIWLTITGEDEEDNQTLVGFKQDATLLKDKQYDAQILNAKGTLSIGTILDDTPMAIQGLPPLEANSEYRIPLYLFSKEPGQFELSVQRNAAFEGIEVYLKMPNQIAEYYLDDQVILIDLYAGKNAGYELIFRKGTVLNTIVPMKPSLNFVQLEESIRIDQSSLRQDAALIELIDIKGVVHRQIKSSDPVVEILTHGLAAGVYMLRYSSNGHEEVVKIVLR